MPSREAQRLHWNWTKRECRLANYNGRLYIAGDRWNLAFTDYEVAMVESYWQQGVCGLEICEKMDFRQTELATLAMDLGEVLNRRTGLYRLEPRPGGIFGEECSMTIRRKER